MKKRGKMKKSISSITASAMLTTAIIGSIGLAPQKSEAAGQSWNFGYTGASQSFTAPYSGQYRMEVWGAQGGNLSSYAGYSTGTVSLNAGQVIYVYVGGAGKSGYNNGSLLPGGYNGGGAVVSPYPDGNDGSGGGATDIRTSSSGSWSDYLNTRIIVAGGGGGGVGPMTQIGYGGGTTGYSGTFNSSNTATGGTQSSGGTGNYANGSFGFGANGSRAGGGGGWYGGGSAWQGFAGGGSAGGGGSGYIGGVQSGQMIAGNATMPNTSGGTEVGHTGSGYARITSMNETDPPTITSSSIQGYAPYQATNVSSGAMRLLWGYSDASPQGAYKIVGSRDNWATWSYDSGWVSSSNGYHDINFSSLSEGTWHYAVSLRDQYGNESGFLGDYHIIIDRTAPSSAILSPSTTSPTNADVLVTITYPGDAAVKEYKIGSSGTWTAYTSAVAMSADGTIYARSKDAAGNISAETSLIISNIDKVVPTSPSIAYGGGYVAGNWTNANVAFTLTAGTDAKSGVARTEYRTSLNGGAWSSWTTYSSSVSITQDGITDIQYRTVDNAGNATTATSQVKLDKVAPITPTLIADKTAPTNTDVSVTVTYSGDSVTKQYKVGAGGTWTTYTVPVVLSSNNTLYARAYDQAGNLSTEGSLLVGNIDKVAPTVPTLVADKTNPTNTDVTVSVTYPGDAALKEVRINGGAWTTYTTSVVMTANGTVEARATDNAGNVSTLGSLTVSNIDKVAPVNATLTPDKTTPTNGNVTVTITYPGDGAVMEYRINGGAWTTYTAAVVFSANGKIEARSTDIAGNVSGIVSYDVTNIDKVAPVNATITPDKTLPTNTNVTVTVNYPTDGSVKEYRVNGSTWTTYTAPVMMSANGKVEARSTDVAGNTSGITSYDVTNIDKIAPVNATFAPDKTSPTNTDVTVTVSYPADGAVKEIRVNGGVWTAYTTSVFFTANGTLEARSTDVAGNVSAVATYNVTNIDKQTPIDATFTPDKLNPTNTDVAVSISYPMDAVVREYKIGASGTWTAYTTPIVMTGNGTIYARSTDDAGNVSAVTSYDVTNIDKVAPVNTTFAPSKTEPTNADVTVTVNYPADGSVKEVRVNGGSWTSYTTPIVFTSNGKVEARSTDVAGNVSAVTSYDVTNIDKVAPVIATITPDKTTPTNMDVTVTISYPSDVAGKEVRINEGSWTAYTAPIVFSENGKVEARSTDLAGNTSLGASYDVANIDKISPVVATLTADKTLPTNTDVKVTISYPMDAVVKEYKIGTAGTWSAYTSPIVMTGNGTVYARSQDDAGNWSVDGKLNVTNIDKVAPTTPVLVADKTNPTNTDVKVTISYPSDANVKEYRVNGGVWNAYTSAIVFSENGLVEARTTDDAGNISQLGSLTVDNIDKVTPTTPTLVADKILPTNTDVKVTITFPSDAVAKEVRINGGSWTTYTSDVIFSENGTIEARGTDNAGNTSLVNSLTVNNIDKVSPENATFIPSKTAPTNEDVTVTITYPSDAKVKEYKIGTSGTWTDYEGAIVMTADGEIFARSKDAANNVSNETSYRVTNIDKVAPTMSLSPNTTLPTNQNVTVTATIADTKSGVAVKKYATGDQSASYFGSNGVVFVEDNFVLANNGTYTVYAKDSAGNESIQTIVVSNIDKTAPIMTLTPNMTTPTNQDVTVTVNTSDTDVVVKKYAVGDRPASYFGTNGTSIDGNTFVIASNGTYTVYLKDNAGNETVQKIDATNIDKVAPNAPVLSASKELPTNEDVVVTISFPDDAVQKEYRIGTSGTWTSYVEPITMTGNGVIYARATDNADNASNLATLTVDNMDKVAPTKPFISIDSNKLTVVGGTDGQLGVSKTLVKINGGMWTIYTGEIELPDGQYTILAKTVDKAGNESEVEAFERLVFTTALENATNAVQSAEASITQSQVNQALTLVGYLPEGIEKQGLKNRLIQLQGQIDQTAINSRMLEIRIALSNGNVNLPLVREWISDVENLDKKADGLPSNFDKESTKTLLSVLSVDLKLTESVLNLSNFSSLSDISSLVDVMLDMPDGELKDELQEKINSVSGVFEATNAVEALENSISRDHLFEAKTLVNHVLNDSDKARLTDRIEKVENKIVARESVEKVENSFEKFDYERALLKIDNIPDGSFKNDLNDRLITIKGIIDTVELVAIAERTRKQEDIDTARVQVEKRTNGTLKEDLAFRLDRYDMNLRSATSKVKYAETFPTAKYVQEARALISKLVASEKKNELIARIDVVEAKVIQNAYRNAVNAATKKVEQAEQYKRNPYIADAYKLVENLPNGSEKNVLVSRLDTLEGSQNDDQKDIQLLNGIKDAKKRAFLQDVMKAVDRAERYVSKANIEYALGKVENIPTAYNEDADCLPVVEALKARAMKLKNSFNTNLETKENQQAAEYASRIVDFYERYKLKSYKESAQKVVDQLPAGSIKDSLQARIDAVKK